jgi:signal transduction histidine kinase
MPTVSRRAGIAALFAATLAALLSATADAAEPRHVLLIHSFGRDFAPYDTITAVFRTELAQRLPERVVIHEATLDAGRTVSKEEERAFFDYLRARFADRAPDLVVTIGPPAARFYLAYRDQLFPTTPYLLAAVDQRLARGAALRASDAAILGKVDLPLLVDNILRLLPETKTIAVVIGASDLERFWLSELQREFAPFNDRVAFLWLNELSLEQTERRLSTLPERSAVLYGLLITDAAGVPHERQDALARLHEVSRAPIFGLYENELGRGVVGGPYSSQRRRGQQMAEEANRILEGGSRSGPQARVSGFEAPVYDWRELRRWNIDEARLPPGSEIRFRPPSLWDEHRGAVIVTAIVLVLQAALIAGLLWQRNRRLGAEREAHDLGGRLITAHEDERRRVARDLHDDVTQRLAGLAIDAAKFEHDRPGDGGAHAIRAGLVGLSEDVHALAYRLHPSVIEDLGLVEALRAECDRVARQEPLRVDLDSSAVPVQLPADLSIGLFRIAQEALRNVVRHAKATRVEVSLQRKDGGLVLAVRDDGAGFDELRKGNRVSLGLASMRERTRVLGGKLDVRSRPSRGTEIVAWVPLPEAA